MKEMMRFAMITQHLSPVRWTVSQSAHLFLEPPFSCMTPESIGPNN